MLTPLSRPVSPDQGLNNTTHLFLQKSRVYQHHLQHIHGAGEVQLNNRYETGHHTGNHGAGTVHPDSRQQPGSSGSAATSTSIRPIPTCEWESHYSYNSSGTTSQGQGTRRQAVWNSIEGIYGAIRLGEVQHHHPSGAAVQGTGPYRRLGTSWRQHKNSLHNMGENVSPPNVSQRLLALFGLTPDD